MCVFRKYNSKRYVMYFIEMIEAVVIRDYLSENVLNVFKFLSSYTTKAKYLECLVIL